MAVEAFPFDGSRRPSHLMAVEAFPFDGSRRPSHLMAVEAFPFDGSRGLPPVRGSESCFTSSDIRSWKGICLSRSCTCTGLYKTQGNCICKLKNLMEYKPTKTELETVVDRIFGTKVT